jgi:ParB family chromosome partitioning protein
MAVNLKGLGKGLGALISTEQVQSVDDSSVVEVNIEDIAPNKNQPRKYFDDELIQELSGSIKEFGIIQPLILKDEGNYYTIIAGERRWRAARLAGLHNIPAIIKDYTELEIIQIALIENIQRQDLNPIEEALCYKRLIDGYFFSVDELSNKVSKSKNSIYTLISLLNLDDIVQNFIISGELSISHARLLLSLDDTTKQRDMAEMIVKSDLSVREVNDILSSRNTKVEVKRDNRNVYKETEMELKSLLGSKVNIKDKNNKGKLEIEYSSKEELERIIELLYIIKTNKDYN